MTCYKSLLAFDGLLKQYYRLYLKEFAYGGVNDDEFEELKRLFVEACRMAKTLLCDFVRKYDDTGPDDFDVVLERAEHLEVLHYSSCWKKMYHEHLSHVEENRMTPKDRSGVFSAYDLLKIPNYKLAAWIVIEKENGVTGKDNPELLRKLYHYFSELSPYRNNYPGCAFTTQAEIWYQAENHDYGDIHPDDWEGCVWDYFEKSMEKNKNDKDMSVIVTFSALYENMQTILETPANYDEKITHFSAGGLGACAYSDDITVGELARCWQHEEYHIKCPHCKEVAYITCWTGHVGAGGYWVINGYCPHCGKECRYEKYTASNACNVHWTTLRKILQEEREAIKNSNNEQKQIKKQMDA